MAPGWPPLPAGGAAQGPVPQLLACSARAWSPHPLQKQPPAACPLRCLENAQALALLCSESLIFSREEMGLKIASLKRSVTCLQATWLENTLREQSRLSRPRVSGPRADPGRAPGAAFLQDRPAAGRRAGPSRGLGTGQGGTTGTTTGQVPGGDRMAPLVLTTLACDRPGHWAAAGLLAGHPVGLQVVEASGQCGHLLLHTVTLYCDTEFHW